MSDASGFMDPSSGIGGVANFTGTVNSNGTQAQSNGDATVDRIKLSPKGSPAQRSVALKYQTTYELQKQVGQIQADVTVGKAIAKLDGTYDLHGDSAVLSMKLNADNMPVDDLETLLPALGVTLPSGSSLQGGTLSADMSVNGPVEKLVITGPVKLVNTKLHGFDMGSKMSAISMLSGVKTGLRHRDSDFQFECARRAVRNSNQQRESGCAFAGNSHWRWHRQPGKRVGLQNESQPERNRGQWGISTGRIERQGRKHSLLYPGYSV